MVTAVVLKHRANSEHGVQAGTRIGGRFTVQALLGRGGMADVYRVRDEVGGAELALKRLRAPSDPHDRRPLALFEREYHTLAQISHPCVVAVCDYGVDEAGAYYTMELVRGEDLRTRGRLEWREACRLLRDIASALAVLHARKWLHRDLSPRNVMCTAEGLAKLIDFGAMAPMGVARTLVGTPPLVPPEAVQQQSLDTRADLYALGALGYFVLTGRHAYPARDFDELRDRWRSMPWPIERLVPEVPAALIRLVLDLLTLDRSARPSSASEVIERLTNMIGDAAEARPESFVAYLSTPKLVGRDQALSSARARMLDSLRGKGAAVLIEGDAGNGRSRFLDACVLEAKLLGAVVLRGDPSDAARGEYGLASALGEQLLQALPELAIDAARMRYELLGRVVRGLARAPADDAARQREPSAHERRHLQTALRDWFMSIARSRRIVIAVDDFDRVDEPSAAWLVALANRSQRRKLVIAATSSRRVKNLAPLELLRATALRIEVGELSIEHTEALLGSLFGDARHLAPVAQHIFEVSEGNPRRIVELCEHLVRRGLARYVAGAWILPEQLGPEELPASIEVALALRLLELDADARELAEALALTDPQALALDAYPLLLADRDHGRAYRALDALVSAGILQPEGESYRFAHQRSKDLLVERLGDPRKRSLHARLAAAVEPASDVVRLARHLMQSGDERRAMDVMFERLRNAPIEHSETMIALLEQAVSASERLGLPARSRFVLRVWLTAISGPLGRLDLFMRYGPDVLRELERACGLCDHRELGDEVPASERLGRALALAQQRHDALPPEQRAFSPLEAIPQICVICATFGAVAAMTFDLDLVQRLPSLAPLTPLSPAVSVVQLLLESIRHHQRGCYEQARALQLAILQRIGEDDRAGIDPSTHLRMRCGVLYSVGILEAMSGNPSALGRVAELRERPGYRANAFRLQVTYYAMQGDVEEARRAERRAELMHLQDGGGHIFPGTGLYTQVIVYWLADDLDGLKQFLEPMRAMAERFPGWRVPYQLTCCHYLRLKGDLPSALAAAEMLAQAVPAGGHIACCWVAATYVMLLSALGRAQEAAAFGLAYLEACRAQSLTVDDTAIAARATAEALSAIGRNDEAVELADPVLSFMLSTGVRGLRLGVWCELRARVALAMRDEPGFHLWAERCGDEYTRGGYSALCAKYGRLLQQAQRAALRVTSPPPSFAETVAPQGESDAMQATVYSRMGECVDALERARCALLLLMEHSRATEGHLYGLIEGRLVHLVSEPQTCVREDLGALLEPRVEAELRATDTTAVRGLSSPPRAAEPAEPNFVGLRCVVLAAARDGETAVAAAAAMVPGPGYETPQAPLLEALARSLLDNDDVDPLTRLV